MQQRFKNSNVYSSFICGKKNIAIVGMRFLSWNIRIILVPTLFNFSDFYSLTLSCSNRGNIRKTLRWFCVRKRIDHWCSVSTGKSQLSGPRFQCEKRQAGTVDSRVGIFLSPLSINDGFCLSGMQEKIAVELPIKFKQILHHMLWLYESIFWEQKKKWAVCTY